MSNIITLTPLGWKQFKKNINSPSTKQQINSWKKSIGMYDRMKKRWKTIGK